MKGTGVAALLLVALFGACTGVGETQDPTTSLGRPTTSTGLPTPSTATPTSTSIVPDTTTTLPPFPESRDGLEHGGDTWVVVLAGSDDFDDPILSDAIEAAAEAGYRTGVTDCDVGAAEALGQPQGNGTVSVYFNSESDAEAARIAFEARGVGGVVAVVQTYCLD